MRIIVTGAAGFLGSHCCDRLLREGHEVVAVDNLATGSRANLAQCQGEPGFEWVAADITRGLPVRGRVDAVADFASPASPMDYARLPIETLQAGSLWCCIAWSWRGSRGAVLLLTSASECHGDPEVHPQREDYWGHVKPIGPRSSCDESKRFAEALTMAFHRVHGLRVRIARVFNTYGPRMRLDRGRAGGAAVDRGQGLRGEPLTVCSRRAAFATWTT